MDMPNDGVVQEDSRMLDSASIDYSEFDSDEGIGPKELEKQLTSLKMEMNNQIEAHLLNSLDLIRQDTQKHVISKIKGIDKLGDMVEDFYEFRHVLVDTKRELTAKLEQFNNEKEHLATVFNHAY